MRGERGQAIVEFALVVPLLLVLILGVVLVAEIGVARLALEHAAAEAARTGSLTNDDSLVRSTVAAAVAPLDASSVKVAIEPTENENPRSSTPRSLSPTYTPRALPMQKSSFSIRVSSKPPEPQPRISQERTVAAESSASSSRAPVIGSKRDLCSEVFHTTLDSEHPNAPRPDLHAQTFRDTSAPTPPRGRRFDVLGSLDRLYLRRAHALGG